MNFKEKKEPVIEIIFGLNLRYTAEDEVLLKKLISNYFRKRSGVINSKIENIAGGLLWVYSKINFLFESEDNWSKKYIADLLGIKSKTIENTASKIMSALRINVFDDRFARKEVADKNPMNDFFMTKEGFIVNKEYVE